MAAAEARCGRHAVQQNGEMFGGKLRGRIPENLHEDSVDLVLASARHDDDPRVVELHRPRA